MGYPHIKGASICRQVVVPVGDGYVVCIEAEIMAADQLGGASVAFTGISKAPLEFFFRGIYADNAKFRVSGALP